MSTTVLVLVFIQLELKGQFQINQIRIVEIVPHGTFGDKFKNHVLQVTPCSLAPPLPLIYLVSPLFLAC